MPRADSAFPVPVLNDILEAFPSKERERFLLGCDPVELRFADILAEPGERIRHVYFPTGSIIAQITPIDRRVGLGVGMVGNEGMVGIPLILGATTSLLPAVVQNAGSTLRMTAVLFRRELQGSPVLQSLLNRYLYVVMTQLARTAACSHFHVVEARLARWLLMTQDRSHSNQFHVTHKFLACMLGARRVCVTTAALALQNRGLIHYCRGDVTVLDRAGLEDASCACYEVDKADYIWILGEVKRPSAT